MRLRIRIRIQGFILMRIRNPDSGFRIQSQGFFILPKSLNKMKTLEIFEFFLNFFRFLIFNTKKLLQNLYLLKSYKIG